MNSLSGGVQDSTTSCRQRVVDRISALIDEGFEREMMRLDCNAESRRSSLRLGVQSDAVFIMSYDAHGPWNIIEGHGRMMTKGI